MDKKVVEFGAWIPDNPTYDGDNHTTNLINVLPKAKGYRSVPKPVLTRNVTVSEPPLGELFHTMLSSGHLTLLGTATSIYQRTLLGYGINKTGYASTLGWSFIRYGNYILATNGVDALQYATITSDSLSTFQDVPTSDTNVPPKGSILAISDPFLFVGHLTAQTNAMQWSVRDNPLSWPPLGSNDAIDGQSGDQIYPTGGAIMGIVPLESTGVIVLQESAINLFQFIGGSEIYQNIVLSNDIGCVSTKSIVSHKDYVYFYSRDGFYAANSTSIANISDNVCTEWFSDHVEDSMINDIQGIYNSNLQVIMWSYTSGTNDGNNLYDRILCYSPKLNKWSVIQLNHDLIGLDMGRGRDLDSLDTIETNLDIFPYNLDSKFLSGGVPMISVIIKDTDGTYNQYFLAGSAMPAQLTTTDTGDTSILIHGVRPIIDDITDEIRDVVQITLIKSDSVKQSGVYDTQFLKANKLDQIHYAHAFTRYARFRINIPEDTTWTTAMGLQVYYEQDGDN